MAEGLPIHPNETPPSLSGGPGRPYMRVLVIGPGAAGASDALRFEAMAPALADRGIELASWTPDAPSGDHDPFAELEAALGPADVIVLRRHYRTWHACLLCGLRTLDLAEAARHGVSFGHEVVFAPYAAVRPLVGLIEQEPGILGERALVYDTDDDLFSADVPHAAEDLLERDLVARILRLVDLVTVTTPVLEAELRPRTAAELRVIRNAVDPAWYRDVVRPPDLVGDPRVVYHGAASRLRDYAAARTAIDSLAPEMPTLRRVWLGSQVPEVAAVVDEVRPWIAGLKPFAAALVAAGPDVGIAPLEDTRYNRARSELHWLEYAMAGAPAVLSGFSDAGPYDVVRDGIDGLIARTPADWRRHLAALAGSPDLRAEIAAAARARVQGEYAGEARAAEWASAYRWAAEHARIGRVGRTAG